MPSWCQSLLRIEVSHEPRLGRTARHDCEVRLYEDIRLSEGQKILLRERLHVPVQFSISTLTECRRTRCTDSDTQHDCRSAHEWIRHCNDMVVCIAPFHAPIQRHTPFEFRVPTQPAVRQKSLRRRRISELPVCIRRPLNIPTRETWTAW